MHAAELIDPYATGVLQEEAHGRLVADLRNIALDAAIQPHWIWTPLADSVSPEEVKWVRYYPRHAKEGLTGLCLTGAKASGVEDRMAAIAGALVRNFIRARVFTTTQLLDMADASGVPDCTCLLVPNFFVGKAMGGTLPPWKVTILQDLLLERHLAGRQTIVYVSDLKALATEYGTSLSQLIQAHYRVLKVD